jgi:hypothetical protein
VYGTIEGSNVAVEIPSDFLSTLIVAVIAIEKKYAHELTGVRNERREEIKKEINRMVAERLEQ